MRPRESSGTQTQTLVSPSRRRSVEYWAERSRVGMPPREWVPSVFAMAWASVGRSPTARHCGGSRSERSQCISAPLVFQPRDPSSFISSKNPPDCRRLEGGGAKTAPPLCAFWCFRSRGAMRTVYTTQRLMESPPDCHTSGFERAGSVFALRLRLRGGGVLSFQTGEMRC